VRYLALLRMRLPPEALQAHKGHDGLKHAGAVPDIDLVRQ
jgi:hypothetical protein